jgi:putative hydrolase of the HAD superfamily
MTVARSAALLLDLDDTLFVERDYVRSGYSSVSSWLGAQLRVPPQVLMASLTEIFDSPARGRAFDTLLAEYGRTDLVDESVRRYRHHTPDIELTPEAEELLATLPRGLPWGIVTDGPTVMQAGKVEALGLHQRVPVIVLTDRLGGRDAWKPSPVGLLDAARRLGVVADQCVYVGDNPHKDFHAARAAGMAPIRYRAAFQVHRDCEAESSYQPDTEITSLLDLPAWVDLSPAG